MKKKITLMLTAALLSCAVLSGCSKKNVDSDMKNDKKSEVKTESGVSDKKFGVVTTIFPEYDWIKQIVGEKEDRFEFTNLFDKGVDLHSYQPTAEDIAKISASDLFVYVGGESDAWVDNALKEKTNEKMQVVNLLETLGDSVKTEEIVEGMQHSHDHDHEKHDDHEHESKKHEDHDHELEHEDHDHEHEHEDHDHEHEHEDHDHKHEHEDHDHDHGEEHHHHENVKDEHVWLSLKNASALVKVLAEKIQAIDPENADIYANNAEVYIKSLHALDEKFAKSVEGASKKTILFGDRFPFRYFVDDYGLNYYAAFTGCSAETEASFETVAFLAKKLDDLGLSKIIVIENSNAKLAKTIVGNTKDKNQELTVLNSMQSVTDEDIKGGLTYYSVMENNLNLIESIIR